MAGEWSGVALPWGESISSFIEPKDDKEVLKTSVLFIVLTSPGERVMLPTFGSGLPGSVFEQNDIFLASSIEDTVREAIRQWDDRITVISFTAVQDTIDGHKLNCRLVYRNAKDPINTQEQELLFAISQESFALFP